MSLPDQFAHDHQGRKFRDVLNDVRIAFDPILQFLDDPGRQQRMLESELHHERPALAGVVRELEDRADVRQFFSNNDGHCTTRFRQAIGVAVRIVMENHGWQRTGRKGSLGVRANVAPRTTRAGAYHNNGGLALWFTRAERYQLPDGMPFRSVAERAKEMEAVIATRRLQPAAAGQL